MKRILCLLLLLSLLASGALAAVETQIGSLENDVYFSKYGNIYTDCAAETFLGEMGFAHGDVASVEILGHALELPVVPAYAYVNSGESAVIVKIDENGNPMENVALAINMGNFAQTYGIAQKQTDEDGSWFWTAMEGVTFPITVTFAMAQQGGYQTEYMVRQLSRTNAREDYAHLTDAQFSNFRKVTTAGMGEGKLYRSSSPINPELGRSVYADAAMKEAGVTVVMNLADSRDEAAAFDGFAGTYYAGAQVVYLSMSVDVLSDDNRKNLARGLRFFAEHPGTYLVHCTEGKDRAGFVCALLSCLMGAELDEVAGDYMTTYENYYGVEKDSEKYASISENILVKTLKSAFGTETLEDVDLKQAAKDYMRACGMTEAEIAALINNLS